MTRTCEECGAVAECNEAQGLLWFTICGHVLCVACSKKPTLHNVSHTRLCANSQYRPETSLHAIAEERRLARVKELAA